MTTAYLVISLLKQSIIPPIQLKIFLSYQMKHYYNIYQTQIYMKVISTFQKIS